MEWGKFSLKFQISLKHSINAAGQGKDPIYEITFHNAIIPNNHSLQSNTLVITN